MENVLNRLTVELIKKDDGEKKIEQQSELTYSCIHKSYAKCESLAFKQNENLMDKPIFLGFVILDLIKLHM